MKLSEEIRRILAVDIDISFFVASKRPTNFKDSVRQDIWSYDIALEWKHRWAGRDE